MTKEMRELLNKRSILLGDAEKSLEAKDMEAYNAKKVAIEALDTEIESRKDMEALRGKFDDQDQQMINRQQALKNKQEDDLLKSRIDNIRSTNDYTRAFIEALAGGYTLRSGRNVEDLRPLYAALTEGGGDPVGSEGGFLVPIDIDNTIMEFRRAEIALADYVNVEKVTTLSGWRAAEVGKAQQPFAAIDEMGDVEGTEEPTFKQIHYKVTKYGGFIPVSNELLDDNAANLMSYLGRWMARKSVLTENSLILARIAAMTAVPFATDEGLATVTTTINVTLDPAISARAIILTNQDGFNFLDLLEDGDGRPLLQPDPTLATGKLLKGRRVVVAPNSRMPNRTAETITYAPVVIGDLKEYLYLFDRKPMEMAATNIGGDAWRTDSTEVRGIMRMDDQLVDTDAAVKIEIQL